MAIPRKKRKNQDRHILGTKGRKRVWDAYFEEGVPKNEIFAGFSQARLMDRRTFDRLIAEFHRNYHWRKGCKQLRDNHPEKVSALAALKEIIDDSPSQYLDEIRVKLRKRGHLRTEPAICQMVHAPVDEGGLGYSTLVLQRKAMQKCYRERLNFLQSLRSGLFQHKNMIWIDESYKRRHEASRRRGFGPRGKVLIRTELFKDDSECSLLAAFNPDGFVPNACKMYRDGIDSDTFVAWVRDYLCPVLGDWRAGQPNSIVVADNVNQHWDPRVEGLIKAEGALLLYLPRYSPELNPIELGFGWLKKYLKRWHRKRFGGTMQGLEDCLWEGMRVLTRTKARNCCRDCGYDICSLGEEEQCRSMVTKLGSILAVSQIPILLHSAVVAALRLQQVGE